MIRALPILLLASASHAQPLFEDRSDGLPEHIYGGGWEHFVGGGTAVFDCNGDRNPEIFAAGGGNPSILLINRAEGSGGTLAFEPATPDGLRLTEH